MIAKSKAAIETMGNRFSKLLLPHSAEHIPEEVQRSTARIAIVGSDIFHGYDRVGDAKRQASVIDRNFVEANVPTVTLIKPIILDAATAYSSPSVQNSQLLAYSLNEMLDEEDSVILEEEVARVDTSHPRLDASLIIRDSLERLDELAGPDKQKVLVTPITPTLADRSFSRVGQADMHLGKIMELTGVTSVGAAEWTSRA